MNKLAPWRIDPATIEFPQDSLEFHGGFATVSRALLVTSSSDGDMKSDTAPAGGENKSAGEIPSKKVNNDATLLAVHALN